MLQQGVPSVQKVEPFQLNDGSQSKRSVCRVEETRHESDVQVGHDAERGGTVRGADAGAADGVARHVAHTAAELRGGVVTRCPYVQRLRPDDVVPARQHHAKQRAAGRQHEAHAHAVA